MKDGIWERIDIVHDRMFSYFKDKTQVDEFCAGHTTVKRTDFTMMPVGVREMARWVNAIDDARAECLALDEAENQPYGLEFVMRCRLAMDGIKVQIPWILEQAHISIATYYLRMRTISDIVTYHATKKGLL